MQNPVMYIIANKGLGMSPGKLAAQVAHAAVRSAWNSSPAEVVDEWLDKGETKIVLEARDTEHLLLSERYLNERGIRTFLVIDEGRTEIAPHSATALAAEIVDKNDEKVRVAFGDFKTYKVDTEIAIQFADSEERLRALTDALGTLSFRQKNKVLAKFDRLLA